MHSDFVYAPRFRVPPTRCAADYGNAEKNDRDDGVATMESLYFGSRNSTAFGKCSGIGAGPWVMADVSGARRQRYTRTPVLTGWVS